MQAPLLTSSHVWCRLSVGLNMHLLAGAQAAAHDEHVPSTAFAHCLYVREAASYMHAPSGVHAGPKWKQVPLPLDWHAKYAFTPT